MRSLLFVPGDDARKSGKAMASDADAVILDLEDSVAPARKAAARETAAAALAGASRGAWPRLIVRVNALATGETAADLAAVMPHRPDALMLPKAQGGGDVLALARLAGVPVDVIAIATESARALFRLESYGSAAPPLAGLTWGIEDLAADIGAAGMREAGAFTDTARLARALCLVAATAAGVQAIDGVYTDFRDADGLMAECASAARDGFTGKLAIHPAQIEPINRAFTPSPHLVDEARRIVAAFAAAGDPGVIALDGRMLDRPHLERARRLIARSEVITRQA